MAGKDCERMVKAFIIDLYEEFKLYSRSIFFLARVVVTVQCVFFFVCRILASIDWFEGNTYRNMPYFIGKSMVSYRFSLKPTH